MPDLSYLLAQLYDVEYVGCVDVDAGIVMVDDPCLDISAE